MILKLKDKPEKVFWSETKQFTLIDDEGNEYDIRIGENSKFTEYFRWYEPGGWDEIIEVPILDYLENQFSDDEWEKEYEETKKLEQKMTVSMDEWIEEHALPTEQEQVRQLVSRLMMDLAGTDGNYKERFYDAYHFAAARLEKLSRPQA